MKKTKIAVIIFLSLFAILLLSGCRRDDKPERVPGQGLEYTSFGDGSCYVSGMGSCTDVDLVIPATSPEGDSVVAIGDEAFKENANILSVVLPDSVKSIGNYSFASCVSLKSISIPDGLVSFGEGALSHCLNLVGVSIPEGITEIPDSCFTECMSLTKITIPSTVTKIGDFAFMTCYSLVEICNKSSLTITDEVNYTDYLGNRALHIYTDESETRLRKIDDCVFYDDGEEVKLVKYLGDKTHLTLPLYTDGRGYAIHSFAFTNNSTVAVLKIPEGVEKISYSAFENPLSLVRVSIPASVSTIEGGAFFNCMSLIEICNASSIDVSKYAKNVVSNEAESGIRTVSDCVFYHDGNELRLVKYLGNDATVSLPSEHFGDESYVIHEWAFVSIGARAGSAGIKKVIIPDCVSAIDSYAFNGCSSINELVIGDGVTKIGGAAFGGCLNIKSVSIGKGLSDLGDLFSDSRELQSFSVHEENQHYKSVDGNLYSKDGRTLIKYAVGKEDSVFVIPDGVIEIGRNAVANATGLTTIVLPEGLVKIGDRAFYGVGGITKLVFPSSVETVGKMAFTGLGLSDGDGNVTVKVYFTGSEEEWKEIYRSNNKNQQGLPYMANYDYVRKE